ncbi:c-type cytochrome biogenesis protein CcmI [Histidinibacterium aquaticum]|uniref:C-type cytochrome biogenesis protein CcmI n=1 Tax=Histidinibacterium aquaticum TaxID=2613962 RepID=A0A5J5GMB6_9RHOB|nr:c-type cytochrome biogenesis protein CcmI [Histidinibacterium aquaticum]KAA9009335.1 c-type cytochrome biogenesis protein CcmI [Histidinibacterium aquaticum]
MIFFLICAAAALLVAGSLVLPLLRGGAEGDTRSEVAIYRAQLEEIDRDIARGVLDGEEAERTRTEIARRLLAADRAQAEAGGDAPRRATRVAAGLTGLAIVAVAGGLYAWLGAADLSGPYPDIPRAARIAQAEEMRESRPSQAALEAAAPEIAADTSDAPEDYLEMVAQLREIVPTRPDDLQGWELLARHEAALGNYAAAARAQERVIALMGEEATVEDQVRLLDLMVAATAGVVSPEAEALTDVILASDDENLAARYYVGLLYAQTDRPDVAFRIWRDVITEGPTENPYVRLSRGQIEEAAFRAGEEFQLPPEVESVPGPSQEDMEAAAEMDPEARQEMIEGMVARLEGRLASQGGTAEDWARLISAKGVLGETEQAQAILDEARGVFEESEEALALIERAAEGAGLE